MTHLSPGRRHSPSRLGFGIDRLRLREAITSRRAALAELETAMVAVCEQQAARGAGHDVRIDDRTTWDKPMWDRYLAAAENHEADYMPRMLRLLGEIDRFERMMSLALAPEGKAT